VIVTLGTKAITATNMRPQRRPDIDFLRVLATGAVFLFHCAKFFDPGGWHLTNSPTSETLGRLVAATSLWLMPLFFLLSGTSSGLALASRTATKLLADRVWRLLLPFVFGVIAIVPPQVWVERIGHGAFDGPYWSFYPHYFDGLYGFGGNFAWMGLHLWYLLTLFLVTMFSLPVLRPLATRVADTPLFLLAPVLVTTAIEIALIGHAMDRRDLGGWSLLQYPVFFWFGVVLSGQPRARKVLERYGSFLLALGILCGGIWAFAPEHLTPAVPPAIWRALRVAGAWGLLYGLLGLAERHVRGRAWIPPLNRASMPFYVLHQTVILLIALWLLPWVAPIAIKYVALAALSFGVTAALTLGVVRFPFLSLLFGLGSGARSRHVARLL
jgi:peptidoglycan/LPS O-acetylase OafA/YrhL